MPSIPRRSASLFLGLLLLTLAGVPGPGAFCAVPPREKPAAAASRGAVSAKTRPLPAVPAKPLVFPEIVLNNRSYYDLRKIAVRYGFQTRVALNRKKKRTLTWITTRNETIVFTETEQLFQIGGTTASLSFPVAFQKNTFLLEKTDYTEFLEPILRTALLPRRVIRHIVLDPGHGGKDQGASNGIVLEKDLNLLVSRKVAAILRKRGYTVTMTRTGDSDLTLAQRCAFAKQKKADLFLSIHCNSAEDVSIHGIELFLANPAGAPSFGTTTIGKNGAATPYEKTSALWAFLTQRAMLSATKAADRGIKRKQFKVIIDSPAPALLVELGFLSNPGECANLLKPSFQDKEAVAICDAIDRLKKTLKPR